MKKKMLINVADEEESRVAIMEDGVLEEFTIETSSKEQIKGNIYNGVVVKVEPSPKPVFMKGVNTSEFFVRVGNTTRPLDLEASHDYIRMHWEN